jgi:hypothetical protein
MGGIAYGYGVCANCRKPIYLTSKPIWQHKERGSCLEPEAKIWDSEWNSNKRLPVIVGICGFAQSGKDTLANQIVQRDGFERMAFADPMRNILYALNPTIERHSSGLARTVRLQQLINTVGWERAKNDYPEVRQLLQRLGTEGGRKHISEDVWVRATLNNITSNMVVIPDVRFPNEAEAIKMLGGTIVRVVRNGVEPTNEHASETAYTDQDFVVYNNGTPDDLYRNYGEALNKYWKEKGKL